MPTLYLLPVTMSDSDPSCVLPPYNLAVASRLRHFIVENVRTARRFLRRCDSACDIDSLTFYELNGHTPAEVIPSYLAPMERGEDMGVMSEAGCPAVADPGAQVVGLAQRRGYKVVPLVGPSSILLSLMASGFNGQGFSFHGYLPIEAADRDKTLRNLEALSRRTGMTQIFIETPYRNDRMLARMLQVLQPSTMLCIGRDITSPDGESIVSRTVAQWNKNIPELGKVPTIFLIHSYK